VSQTHIWQSTIRDGVNPVDLEKLATITLTVRAEQADGIVIGDIVTLTGNDDPKDFLVERIDFNTGADSTLHLRSMVSAPPELVQLSLPEEELPEDDMNIYHELTQ